MGDPSTAPTTDDRLPAMLAALDKSGYYPDVVAEGVRGSLAGEDVVSFVVHHEPTFDQDEVRRHLTVVVLTPTRLLVTHTDDHPPDDLLQAPYTTTATEAVRLGEVRSVTVSRYVPHPAADGPRDPAEVVLTIGWGTLTRVDLEPAGCGDPECVADHGYTGSLAGDDFTLRVSAAADGPEAIPAVLEFADTLSRLTSR